MTNFEHLKSLNEKELAEELCQLFDDPNVDDVFICDVCPARNLCKANKGKANGFIKWLQEERKD